MHRLRHELFRQPVSATACADGVTGWFIRNDLLLKSNKTEAIITGTRQKLAKFDQSDGIIVSRSTVPFVPKLRVLGMTIDSELIFDDHVTDVLRACNYHIRALRHIRPFTHQDTSKTIACSIVFSKLDYCNAILYGITDHYLNRLQRVQNSLPRIVCVAPYRSPATRLRRSLHRRRIEYQVVSLAFNIRLHNCLPICRSLSSTTRL